MLLSLKRLEEEVESEAPTTIDGDILLLLLLLGIVVPAFREDRRKALFVLLLLCVLNVGDDRS